MPSVKAIHQYWLGEQIGNAVPPLLAAHVLSAATGITFTASTKAAA